MVNKYIDGGGKALIEIDPQTEPKLDDILQAWNVSEGQNVVVDASGVGRMFGTGPAVPLVVDYGDNPITKNLKGGMTFSPSRAPCLSPTRTRASRRTSNSSKLQLKASLSPT